MRSIEVTLRASGARGSGKSQILSVLEAALHNAPFNCTVKLIGKRFEGDAANGTEVVRYKVEFSE